MGADLYIDKLPKEAQIRGFEVSQDAVKAGYFRDCYNSGGLFAVLSASGVADLSWWQLSREHETDWFDQSGRMTVKGANEFRQLLFVAKLKLQRTPTLYQMTYDGKCTKLTGKARKEYVEWLDLLLKFLDLAIEKQSLILWSV